MSDISVDADYEFPFEVRSAGDSGLGCFATRDIKPGEIVLVDFTPIIVPSEGDKSIICAQLANIYEGLDEQDQSGWRSLAAHIRQNWWELYRSYYRQPRPNGAPPFPGSPELYAMLALQFDCNSFDIINTELSALYLQASRFNHSCDPNIWYENERVVGRWVGRANRNIAQGEELFISYIAYHAPTAERQTMTQCWNFACGCDKCLERNDIYTAFLEDARDVANNTGVEWARTLTPFVDDLGNMEERLLQRVDLLKEACRQDVGEDDGDNSFKKETLFALWDLADFHRHYYINYRREGNKEKFVQHLKSAVDYIRQAEAMANRIWPRTHEIVIMLNKEVRRWQNTWNHRNEPPLGLAD